MPVVYPVAEKIARELYDRLSGMVNSNDYQTKVRSVIRPTRNGNFTPSHLQIVMVKGESETIPELTYPGNPPGIARLAKFNLHCHLLTDERSITPIEQEVEIFAADVVKAITADADWYLFDNNAIDCTISDPLPIQADGGVDGFKLELEILYRVKENDPYTVRS